MKSAAALAATGLLLVSASASHAAGDPAAGEKIFHRCKICHTIEEGGPPKQGPNLYGVYGRQAGSTEPGSLHSEALSGSGVVWNEETLTEWLKGPSRFIPGVKMTFRMTNEQEIADVIAYLKANSPGAE
jgi:cytochrome c